MVSTHVKQVQLVLGVQLGLDDRLLVLVGNMVYIHTLELEMEDVGLVLAVLAAIYVRPGSSRAQPVSF